MPVEIFSVIRISVVTIPSMSIKIITNKVGLSGTAISNLKKLKKHQTLREVKRTFPLLF